MSTIPGSSIYRSDGVPVAQYHNPTLNQPETQTGGGGGADVRPIVHQDGQAWKKLYFAALAAADQNVKSSGAGKLGGWHLYNANNYDVFVQVFDKASNAAVTVGTTPPDLVLVVPANGVLDAPPSDTGVDFDLGIVVAATITAGGAGAPGVGILANFFYI